MQQIGITERGDTALHYQWTKWTEAGNPAILITKNPQALASYLPNLSQHNIIVHATITGYGGTKIEPNVPDYTSALEGYRELIDLLGVDRVVLRIDPIIPTEDGLTRVSDVAKACQGRMRISFLDNYPHDSIREKNHIGATDRYYVEGR